MAGYCRIQFEDFAISATLPCSPWMQNLLVQGVMALCCETLEESRVWHQSRWAKWRGEFALVSVNPPSPQPEKTEE